MGKGKIKPNIDKLLDDMENMEQKEINQILDVANYIYSCLDVPIIVLNDDTIKTNTLIIAMYLVGREIGKAEQKQDK